MAGSTQRFTLDDSEVVRNYTQGIHETLDQLSIQQIMTVETIEKLHTMQLDMQDDFRQQIQNLIRPMGEPHRYKATVDTAGERLAELRRKLGFDARVISFSSTEQCPSTNASIVPRPAPHTNANSSASTEQCPSTNASIVPRPAPHTNANSSALPYLDWIMHGFNEDVAGLGTEVTMKGKLFEDELLGNLMERSSAESNTMIFGGSTREETTESFSVGVGVTGGFGSMFSASVNTQYSQASAHESTTAFRQFRQEKIFKGRDLKDSSGPAMREFLTEHAKRMIDHGNPQDLFEQFGLFFLSSMSWGGCVTTTFHSKSAKVTDSSRFELHAEASGGMAGFHIGAKTDMKFEQGHEYENEEYHMIKNVYGGREDCHEKALSEEGLSEWQGTLNANPTVVKKKCVGIWQLAEDEDRISLLRAAAVRTAQADAQAARQGQ